MKNTLKNFQQWQVLHEFECSERYVKLNENWFKQKQKFTVGCFILLKCQEQRDWEIYIFIRIAMAV